MHYTCAIETFVTRLQESFSYEFFDWIDAPEDKGTGLNDVDENKKNPTLFEVDVGLSVGTLTEEQVETAHNRIVSFADKEGVSVELIEANETVCVYRFYLHSIFLGSDVE